MPQRWVLVRRAEVPEVVINSVLVQVHVPVLVDARVARWRLRLSGRLALAAGALGLAGGLGIPVAVAGGPSVREVAADEAAYVAGVTGNSAYGVAGDDCADEVAPDQAAGVGAARHAGGGVAGYDPGRSPDKGAWAVPTPLGSG